MAFRPSKTLKEDEHRRLLDLLDNLPIVDRAAPLPKQKGKLRKGKGGHLRKVEQR